MPACLEVCAQITTGGGHAYLLQPRTNYRTPDFGKALSARTVQKTVKRWADYSRLGDLSPRDLRRPAITKAPESGLSYRRAQMMSKHKDPKTVMRYDRGRENLDQSAVFLLRDEIDCAGFLRRGIEARPARLATQALYARGL